MAARLGHERTVTSQCGSKRDSGLSQISGNKTGFDIPHLYWLGQLEAHEVKQLQWETCYFEEDPDKTDLIANGKVIFLSLDANACIF